MMSVRFYRTVFTLAALFLTAIGMCYILLACLSAFGWHGCVEGGALLLCRSGRPVCRITCGAAALRLLSPGCILSAALCAAACCKSPPAGARADIR